MDKDGYPDEDELRCIREWPRTSWSNSYAALLKFVGTLWHWSDWGFKEEGLFYELHTGGWSGNESVIEALRENVIFWNVCWQESKRGGHYKFEVPVPF